MTPLHLQVSDDFPSHWGEKSLSYSLGFKISMIQKKKKIKFLWFNRLQSIWSYSIFPPSQISVRKLHRPLWDLPQTCQTWAYLRASVVSVHFTCNVLPSDTYMSHILTSLQYDLCLNYSLSKRPSMTSSMLHHIILLYFASSFEITTTCYIDYILFLFSFLCRI